MKKLKKFVALMAATALMIVLPTGNTLTASADEATTFLVCYHDGEWIYQEDASSYDEDIDEEEVDDLERKIENGDILVIDGSDEHEGISLDLEDVYLSNLTIKDTDIAVVKTAGISECHVLDGAIASVSGDISSAYVYGKGRATFVDNVSYLEVKGEKDLDAYVTVGGVVGHLKGQCDDNDVPNYEYFNVADDKLVIEKGDVETDDDYYSTTPSGSAPAATPSAPAQNTTSSGSASGDYDDVPKTGEGIPAYMLLLGIAAICFAGKKLLKNA